MGQLVVFALLAGIAVCALFRPWIGVVVSYLIIILTPQSVWWWHFADVRPVFWVMLPTIAGVIISYGKGSLNFNLLWNKRNFWMFVLWGCFILSYFLGPYTKAISELRSFDPWWTLSLVNNIFILYFIACVCIDDEKKLKIIVGVLVCSTIYLIYWANDQYLFQGRFGRIGGPVGPLGGSIYHDENAFAMLFVTGLPFLYYAGLSFRNKLYRYVLWLVIPFGWHAIFLTASRGGLVGLAVTILVMALLAKRNILRILLVPAFIFMFYWQAGSLMHDRAMTISEYETDRSSATRIEAWSTAINMITNHPLSGVGIASFIPAFPDHSKFEPREAHNTFFQITAETGVFGGLAYVMILWLNLRDFRKNKNNLIIHNQNALLGNQCFLALINEAVQVSFIGIITCSLFLSLHVYELFYFLCLLLNTISFLSISKSTSSTVNSIN